MPQVTSPNRLGSFLRVSLILFSSCALLGAMIGPMLYLVWVPENLTLLEMLFWPIVIFAPVLKIGGGLGLIVSGALGYGTVGWALGILIWGLWQWTHRPRHP